VLPGQLPGSFEADERAHPALSSDLLHLVHGRTLLGVVRLQQPLQIAGEHDGWGRSFLAAAAAAAVAARSAFVYGLTHVVNVALLNRTCGSRCSQLEACTSQPETPLHWCCMDGPWAIDDEQGRAFCFMLAAVFACVLLQVVQKRQQRCQEQYSKVGRCPCHLQHQCCLQALVRCHQQQPQQQHLLLKQRGILRRQALMTQAPLRGPT
jgi:hypothetical protein